VAEVLIQTTGRRKTSVARVRVRPGTGKITANERALDNYFPSPSVRKLIMRPLELTKVSDRYDVDAALNGGGVSSQAGALCLGISRAIAKLHPESRVDLKKAGLLTRDSREKESKKYGLKKARKAPQYTKR
jgi:small subunit ribosomal protein S9